MLTCPHCGKALGSSSAVCDCQRKPVNNDGGPAFPVEGRAYGDALGGQLHHGMTLRDWFAGQALAGWLASYCDTPCHPADNSPDARLSVARASYDMADAMLAERAKGKP